MTTPTEHSPLGGSGAARWMQCPGSVKLSHGIEDENTEFSLPGTQAHALAEHCLKTGADAWTLIRDDTVVDKEMADAVQVYLDFIRGKYPDANQSNSFIEYQFHCPDVHEYFWGMADHAFYDVDTRLLEITDYKHGAGIVVEAPNNAQLMYYGVGVLTKLGLWHEAEFIMLRIVQPRGFHFDGPIREWALLTEELRQWRDEVLIPAMDLALTSDDTASGEHCRFCPARSHSCPQLIEDFDELEEMILEFSKANSADKLTNVQVGRFLELFDVAKIVAKAANTTAFNRLVAGASIPGRKLVKSRTNREFREEAEAELIKKYGKKKAFSAPKLLSPAQVDALPEGKAFTARHAFKPDAGQTIAADKDTRPKVAGGVKQFFEDQTAKKVKK